MKTSTLVFIIWAVAAFIWGAVHLAYNAGLRINHTTSLPMGLWRVRAIDRPIVRGDTVSFCPPDTATFQLGRQRGYFGHGACPHDYEPLLKPVVAVAGDVVEVTASGVAVNGRLVANSVPLFMDTQGREMPQLEARVFTVADGDLLLISSYSADSFDGRYFGAIPVGHVTGFASRL